MWFLIVLYVLEWYRVKIIGIAEQLFIKVFRPLWGTAFVLFFFLFTSCYSGKNCVEQSR